MGAAMPIWQWAALAAVTWAALLPFVLLGIGLGYVGTSESVQAVTTFVVLALALLGGMWFPIEIMPPMAQTIAQALPSYWLNAVGRAVMGAPGFGWTGPAVLAGWTVVLAAFALVRYRADAKRT